MLLVPTVVRPGRHGLGLFAARDIPRGARVWTHEPSTVVELSREQLAALRRSHEGGGAMAAFLDRFAYRPRGSGSAFLELDDMRFINHAAHPNVVNRRDGPGSCVMVAARDVRAGEELFEDYAADYELELCAAFLARQ